MSAQLHSWTCSEELKCSQLDGLPWVAYLCLVKGFFEQSGYRLRLIRSFNDRSEFSMVSAQGERQLLVCCSAQAAQRGQVLLQLKQLMSEFRVGQAVLVTPGGFDQSIVEASRHSAIELYSGERLVALVAGLPVAQRQRVLGCIRAEPTEH